MTNYVAVLVLGTCLGIIFYSVIDFYPFQKGTPGVKFLEKVVFINYIIRRFCGKQGNS